MEEFFENQKNNIIAKFDDLEIQKRMLQRLTLV